MSTPASPDSPLQGPEFYAPRRIRMRSGAPVESLPPLAATGERRDLDKSNGHTNGWQSDDPAAQDDFAQAAPIELLDAIRLALRTGDGDGRKRPGADGKRLPPAANLKPPQRAAIEGTSSAAAPPPWKTARSTQPHRRLDPQIIPEPIGEPRSGISVPHTLLVALAFGVAAMSAFGITRLLHPSGALDGRPSHRLVAAATADAATPAHPVASIKPQLPPQLLVKSETALANQPLPLAVSIERARGHESILLAGLAAGTRLSAGDPVGKSGWRLATADLRHDPHHGFAKLSVYPPSGFVGVMNTAFDLVSPSRRLMDSRVVQLKWIAATPPSSTASGRTGTKHPAASAVKPMKPTLAARLMKEGENLLDIGDIAAARLAFRRVAEAGNADAALALAKTYDPRYLAEHDVIGIAGNEVRAQAWYQRARRLASTQADRILAQSAAK